MSSVYELIADRIISELEAGIIPWKKPWSGKRKGGAISHNTGRPYSLLNQMLLGKPGEYITFNQCKEEGGKVRKGAKARFVTFWKVQPVEQKDANGETVKDADGNAIVHGLPVLRYYQVFHIDDCEGIAPKWGTADGLPECPAAIDERAETVFVDYIKREGIRFEQSLSDEAYYAPYADKLHLPMREQFDATAEYYSTAFHEATHSTGAASRLNRFERGVGVAAFGSESYSKEELVAEIGAASICHEIGIETPNSFRNSAAYIQSWLRKLKNDKRLIVSAAAQAEKAVNLIMPPAVAE